MANPTISAPAASNKLARFLVIAAVALKYCVFYHFNSLRHKPLGERLRLGCQRLGVIFVKVGQLLSGRYDLLSEADLQELKKLLDQGESVDDTIVKEIIQSELGDKASQLGTLTLLSSASIAQVYGTQIEGEPVVIKVLRPGVRQQAETDLTILLWLISFAKHFHPTLRPVRVTQAIEDFRRWIREETDLSIELSNMEKFRLHLTQEFGEQGIIRPGLGKMVVPRTYPEFSTPRILVMERLQGKTVSEWTRDSRPAQIENYDPQTSLLTLFAGSLRPLFEGKSVPFHGDPHPANIVILEHGDVGLIDFGLMCQYGEEVVRAADKLFFAVHLQNAELAAKAALQYNQLSQQYYEEILPDMRIFVKQAADYGFGDWLKGAISALQKHNLFRKDVQKDLTYPNRSVGPILVKFVLLMDSMAHDFFPDKSTADLLGPELKIGIMAHITHNLKRSQPGASLLGLAYAFSEVAAEGPEAIGKMFNNLL